MGKKSILLFYLFYTSLYSSGEFKEIVPLESNFFIENEKIEEKENIIENKGEMKNLPAIKEDSTVEKNIEVKDIPIVEDREEVKETIKKNSTPTITEEQLQKIIANSKNSPSLENEVESEEFHSFNLNREDESNDFFQDIEEKLEKYSFSDKSGSKYAGKVLTKEITSDKIIDNLEFGVGVAYENQEYYDSQYTKQNSDIWTHTPIYATGKYKLSDTEINKKYLKLDLGYAIGEYENIEKYEELKNQSGIYYGIGGGVEFKDITLDLMYQVNKDAYIKDNSPQDDSRITFSVDYKLGF